MKVTVILFAIRRSALFILPGPLKLNHRNVSFAANKFFTYTTSNCLLSNQKRLSVQPICFSTSIKPVSSDEITHLVDSLCQQSRTTDSNKRNEIANVLNYLVSLGYPMEEIKQKCLSYLKPHECSLEKIKQISMLDSNLLNLLPFMLLPNSTLRRAAQQATEDNHQIEGFPNRLTYLSHHLEIPVEELIPAIAKHITLMTMKFQRLDHKMKILKAADISAVDLVKDLWIFNYNEKLLMNRITLSEEAHVKLKPWMLRCSKKFFMGMLNKYSETQRILGDDDIHSYLAKKLDCSEEYVKLMMEMNKYLKKINVIKIDQMVNFLLEKGYTPQEIRIYPTVFSTNIQTLKKRIEVFSGIRSTLPSLSRLCLSAKKFESTIKKLKKNQKCEDKNDE